MTCPTGASRSGRFGGRFVSLLLSNVFFAAAMLGAQLPETQPVRSTAATDPAFDLVFDSAAVVAWRQFDRLWVPETGLARATFDYEKLTTWDIGSVLGGTFSAKVLGFIDEAEYRKRMRLTLETLEHLPLFQDAVYHKVYDARTATMTGRDGAKTTHGYGWSATDLGRLLIWLHIVARTDTMLANHAERVARRIKFERVVADGYLHGEEVTGQRSRRWQEGRIGYEQYAARGFALWGQDVAPALDLNTHAQPVSILGVGLLKDNRGLDRLTSEPFVLLGLEVGWTPDEAALARSLLRAQEARYRETKIVTIASEDAVGIAPHFFYYSCVYCSGKSFVIETASPGRSLTSPRWVSTKATFAWHALLPGDYTAIALERVAPARASIGWSSGVLEKSGAPTRAYDVNTAAIILEAAAYRKLGRPLLSLSASGTAP